VDYHHTVEDIAIVLGQALAQALGDKRGIGRYGQMILPMDEVLMLVAVDISGRSYLGYDVTLCSSKVGDFDTELAEEFMQALVRSAGLTLHCRLLAGHNTHHIIEALFKALARALRQAVAVDVNAADKIPSTKGVI
jgi:imidazoleglycerol-phosphate dehydratase